MNDNRLQFNSAALTNALKLFDPNMADAKKYDVRVALETILSWHVRFRNEYKAIPTAPPIQKNLEAIEKCADGLVKALEKAHPIAMKILNAPDSHGLNVVFGREWQGFIGRKNEHAIYPVTSDLIENLRVLSDLAKNRAQRVIERDHLRGKEARSEHSLAELILPSPTFFLMRECGLLLVANGRGTDNLLKLAKFIYIQALESNKSMAKRWGESAATAVRKWLKSIHPIIGGFTRVGEDGTKLPCLFPSVDQYPNRYDSTVWRCVIPDSDGKARYGDYDLDGPGWPDLTAKKAKKGKKCTSKDLKKYLG